MLRDREKRVLAVGGAAAAALLLLSFVVFPSIARIRAQARAVAAAERDLAEVRNAIPEIGRIQLSIRNREDAVRAAANSNVSPLSRVTATLTEAGIPQAAFTAKSTGTRDGEFFRGETFEVRIENLTYLEAVKVLQKISGGAIPATIRSATLKSRFDDPRYIDTILRIDYLTPKP